MIKINRGINNVSVETLLVLNAAIVTLSIIISVLAILK